MVLYAAADMTKTTNCLSPPNNALKKAQPPALDETDYYKYLKACEYKLSAFSEDSGNCLQGYVFDGKEENPKLFGKQRQALTSSSLLSTNSFRYKKPIW